MIAFLWNNDTKDLKFVEYQSPEPLPVLSWEGRDFHPVNAFPNFYIYPTTEDSLVSLAFTIWKLNLPTMGSRAAFSGAQKLATYEQTYGQDKLDAAAVTSLEKYLYAPYTLVSLKDDQVGVHHNFSFRRAYHDHMEQAIKVLPQRPMRLLEMGSGGGQNILALKSRFPDMEIHGLEMSPQGIELTQILSRQLNLPLQLAAGDFCASLSYPDDHFDVTLVMGVWMEMTEEELRKSFANLYRITKKHIFLYEPFPELWPQGSRGWACLQYYTSRNYLRASLRQLVARSLGGKYQIQSAYRLKNAGNPLNELCFVRLDLLKNGEAGGPDQLSPDYFK